MEERMFSYCSFSFRASGGRDWALTVAQEIIPHKIIQHNLFIIDAGYNISNIQKFKKKE
jgi:hypothetical protein